LKNKFFDKHSPCAQRQSTDGFPSVLFKVHQQLDHAVDAAYGKTNFQTEAQRVAFLFELYQKYTSLFPPQKPKRRAKSRD